jgi:hypothetical protein
MTTAFVLFSCGGEAAPETEGEGAVSTEVNESLQTEQDLNNQVHELHDDLDEVLESL